MFKRKSTRKFKAVACFAAVLALCFTVFTGCGSKEASQVVIYSNADDEAVAAMTDTLNDNGYEGKFIFQSFGTSELGGKLLAEGTDIEADIVTMSSYYMDSAQEQNSMFQDLEFDVDTIKEVPSYYAPFLANQGAILLNTEVMKENNLPTPKSLKMCIRDRLQAVRPSIP